MADDLLVGVGADVAEFQRDAQQIVAIAQSLNRDIARALEGTVIIPDMTADARTAGTQLLAGLRAAVQEGGEGLRRDVGTALVPTSLAGDFTRIANVVRAGTQNISTDLGREGHEAGRALVTGIGSELPAVQSILATMLRGVSTTLAGRLLPNLTPQGTRAGRELIAGLRTAVQAQQGALRADIVGSLIPTSLAADFSRLTGEIQGSAATLARALGAGGENAARELVTGLASGLTAADRVMATFTASVRAELARANLLGNLGRQGELSGAQLVRGVTAAITSGGPSIQRAVSTALIPANLSGQLALITTGVSREIGRITPQLSATGTLAGRALVTSLGAELSQGTAVIVREFSRGAAGAVAGVDIFGDLTPAGQRAGTQLLSGLTQVVLREGTALRGTLATALIPTTVSGELGRLTTTITAGLRDVPPLFLTAGRTAGAAFTASLGTQLAESKALLTGFARDASAALTTSLQIGDTARVGEVAGRALAGSIATGIAAETPRVQAAIGAAFAPRALTGEIGQIVQAVEAQAATLVPSFAATGVEAGRAIAQGVIAGVAPIRQELRSLTAGETIGVVVDSGPIIAATRAQQELLTATEAAANAMRQETAAADAINADGIVQAAAATRTLADAQREWLKEARGGSVEAQALWQRQREAARQAAAEAQRIATQSTQNAAQEVAARAQVRAELANEIRTLGLYGQTVNAANAEAVAGWRAEAAAIRRQAQEVGLARDQMLRLEATVERTEAAFARQAAAATRAAAATSRGAVPAAGVGATAAELATITRQANGARTAVAGLTVAGKTAQQTMTRLGPAIVGVGFGLEALARGGTAADAGLRTTLRAVASFAAFFGGPGLIVAGVAAATAAIVDLFNATRDEVAKTRDQFISSSNAMLKSLDVRGLRTQIEDLTRGIPDITRGGQLTGGALELTRQLTNAQTVLRAIQSLPKISFILPQNITALAAAKVNVDNLTAALLENQRQARETAAALNSPAMQAEAARLAAEEVKRAREEAARTAAAAIAAEQERVRSLITTYNQLTTDSQGQASVVTRLLPIYDNLVTRARQYGTSTSDAAVSVRNLAAELAELKPVQIELATRRLTTDLAPDVPPIAVTGIIDKVEISPALKIRATIPFDPAALSESLRSALDAARAAQGRLDLSGVLGLGRQEVADATEDVTIATAALRREIVLAKAELDGTAVSDSQKAARLELLTGLYRDFADGTNEATEASRNFSDTLGDIGGAARGIASVVREIQGVDDELSRAIESAGRFADALSALSQIKLGDIFGSVGGFLKSVPLIGEAISSAINVGRSALTAITGRDERAANDAILQENNEQLERLRQDLKGFGDSIGDFTGTSRIIQESAILNARRGTSGFGRGFRDVEGLDAELRAAGSSIAILKRRAEELGITIVDAKGRISAQGLDALNEALLLAAREAANFGDSLSDLRTIQDARREIFDIDDAGSAFNDAIDQIRQFAPELAQRFLIGISAATPEARRAAEQAIRDLFDFITQSGIDLTPFLGGFDSVEDFVQSLVTADRSLDTFATTAAQATGEMVNVVRGFRDFNLERARFMATADDPRRNRFATIPLPSPVPVPVGGVTSMTSVGTVTFAPTIQIDGRDKDAGEITTEVVTELRRRARASANPAVRQTVNLLPV